MKNPKTIAAAITAVAAYIRMEEEAIASQLAPKAAAYKPPPERFSPWQLSVRQAQMQMRTQMQLKAYHR